MDLKELEEMIAGLDVIEQAADAILIKRINVTTTNENDWEYVPIKDEHGYHVAVF